MAAREPDEGAAAPDAERRGEADPRRPPPPILLSNARPTPPPAPPARPIPLQAVAQPRPRAAPPPAAIAAPLAPASCDDVLAEGVAYTGAVMKQAREARGLSLEQVCDRTRIPRQHVVHLEADRYDLLPPPVYLRGMLMALAKELRLDGQKVARSYLAAVAATQERAR